MHVLVTGSSGLIGSEAVTFFDKLGFKVTGVDNNMRPTSSAQKVTRRGTASGSNPESPPIRAGDTFAVSESHVVPATKENSLFVAGESGGHKWGVYCGSGSGPWMVL